MDDLDLGYLLAVAAAGIWSPRAVATWLNALGSPRAVVVHLRETPEAPLPAGTERLGEVARARLALIDDAVARATLDNARASGARLVLQGDADFPSPLLELCDPPLVLYVRGDLGCLSGRTVAIVGSRAASAYGRAVATQMAAEFAAFGATVISGLARGVDAAAHKGAIEASLPTVAVLGSGVRALYPQYHALLADEIVERGGAVISEFPPDECARPFQFPMRNRVVAALAQATVVVEASTRSGALITARLSDELGHSVFAVPGDISRPTSRGTNALIADGVPLVTSAADVASFMRWDALVERFDSTDGGASEGDDLLRLLPPEGISIDELAAIAPANAADLAARLTLLELQGAVERGPGGRYAAVRRRRAANASA